MFIFLGYFFYFLRKKRPQKTKTRYFFHRADLLQAELDSANRTILNQSRAMDVTQAELKDTKLDNALLKTAPAGYRYWDKYYPYRSRYLDYWVWWFKK